MYSRGDSGVVGEERIECTAKFYPINNVVTREDLLIAYDGIEEQLQTIIITGSSDISGRQMYVLMYTFQHSPVSIYHSSVNLWYSEHISHSTVVLCM